MGLLHGVRRALLGGAFRGAYDNFASSIVHTYEPARRVLTSYTGPLVRLRRASDNAEADFGYLNNGDLDIAAIAAWAGGASYVVTVYDQAPAGDDVTQATAANQPLYVAAAQNGHAGMRFNGTSHFLRGAFTTGGALSQPFNAFAAAQFAAAAVDDNTYRFLIDGDDDTNRFTLAQNKDTTPDSWVVYAGTPLSGNATDAIWSIWSVLYNGASGQFWKNAVSEASGNIGAQNPDGITIGGERIAAPTLFWEGDITSVVICDPALGDAQRIAMQNAMNAYWGCF